MTNIIKLFNVLIQTTTKIWWVLFIASSIVLFVPYDRFSNLLKFYGDLLTGIFLFSFSYILVDSLRFIFSWFKQYKEKQIKLKDVKRKNCVRNQESEERKIFEFSIVSSKFHKILTNEELLNLFTLICNKISTGKPIAYDDVEKFYCYDLFKMISIPYDSCNVTLCLSEQGTLLCEYLDRFPDGKFIK